MKAFYIWIILFYIILLKKWRRRIRLLENNDKKYQKKSINDRLIQSLDRHITKSFFDLFLKIDQMF